MGQIQDKCEEAYEKIRSLGDTRMQRRKMIFFSIVIVLFLAVLFLDQNRSPVPVKIILGDPWSIGLSTVVLVSMLVGVVLAFVGMFTFKSIRKAKINLKVAE